MKIIIAGSRTLNDYKLVKDAMEHAMKVLQWNPSTIISGTATGIDRQGEIWAKVNAVPVLRFPANWRRYGKGAGHKRNEEMASNADGLIAIWDGMSSGTANMIDVAKAYDLQVYVNRVDLQ